MENSHKNSILIVDDSQTVIMELMRILDKEYIMRAASNGEDGLQAAETYLPDVILLDILMPGMDGYEILTKLKKSENTRHIPVIFITALSDEGDEEKGLALGAADYIVKPFSPEITKLRIRNQMKMLNQQRAMLEHDAMKQKLTSGALNIAMWELDVVADDPISPKNIVKWSQEFRRLLGFTDENDFPNTLDAFVSRLHPEDRQTAFAALTAHWNDRTGQTPYEVEYRMQNKKGEYLYFDGFGTTMRNSAGIPTRITGAVRDISEKKRMERHIAELNENMMVVLDSLPVGIRIVKMDDGQLMYANKASMDIFGCEDFERDVAGKSAFDFMPEIQPNGRTTADMAKEFFASDEAVMDFQCFKLNGELFTARIISRSIQYMGSRSSLAIIEDITEKQHSEKQIIEMNENLVRILNTVPIGISIASLDDGRLTYVNKATMDIFGCEDFDRDLKGRRISEFTPELQPNGRTTVDMLSEFFTGNEPTMDLQYFRLNGDPFTARITPCNINYLDKASSLAIVEDITERKRVEDAISDALNESNRTLEIMKSVLHKSDAMIYVTDLDTDEILFMSESMMRLYGIDEDVIGQPCYKVLQKGLDKRCYFCPCHQLDKEPDDVVIWEEHSTATDRYYRNTDRYIDWPGGKKAHIQFSVDLTDIIQTQQKLARREELLIALNNMAVAFLSQGEKDFDSLMSREVGIFTELINLDRLSVWRNSMKSDGLRASMIYRWDKASGGTTKPTEIFLDAAYSDMAPNWESILASGNAINGPARLQPEQEAATLKASGVMSCYVTPIMINNSLWGFVLFEDRHKERYFDEVSAEIMRSAAFLFVNAVVREEMERELAKTEERKKLMLEEMHRAEIAEESNEAKSRFLATMSHEIRTPMNSILGFAELALDTPDAEASPQLKDYLAKIDDSTKWLLRIINDILDISKIESGKVELDSVAFDLNDICMRCHSVILPEVKKKGIDFVSYTEPTPGKKLLGDPVRLYQALLNLLSNAVKFSDSGVVKFSSLLKSTANNKATVCFEVKDSGIGITSEYADKIFDPFIQVESGSARNYGGTGLGLAITKSIVELMGGKLTFESLPGIGSTFSFEIEFETIDTPDDEPENKKISMLEKPHFNGLVLICEDNLMNQQVICEHLEKVGLRTVVANDGRSGVEMVRERMQKGEKPFDLIFMDIFMPVMDGIETASKIMELSTGTPIVALTANIIVSELEKYKRYGMNDCLGKPFTSQELWYVLLKYLEPVYVSSVSKGYLDSEDEKLQKHLKFNFVTSNQNTYDEIKNAAEDGNIALAERLAHTLKGNAGQIREQKLQEAAAAVEDLLSDGQNRLTEKHMNVLSTELSAVLTKLAPMLSDVQERVQAFADAKTADDLFSRLKTMLVSHNPECINLLGEIRLVPGAEKLAAQIEDFEFKKAVLTLAKLENRMGYAHRHAGNT